jgi:hypothetical protein
MTIDIFSFFVVVGNLMRKKVENCVNKKNVSRSCITFGIHIFFSIFSLSSAGNDVLAEKCLN